MANQHSATVVYKRCPKCKRKTMRKGPPAGSGKPRWVCRGTTGDRAYCYSTVNPDAPYRDQKGEAKDADKNPQFRRKLGGIKRFVITAAQNATPVHEGFWAALQAYCRQNDAELVVIPIRYKNATSRWTASQENAEYWDVPAEYLYNQRKKLNENLILLGDIKTQPTATKPLSGFEAITHGESGILGHTKLQLTTVPTPQGKLPKILTTTGACTVPNYTDSKAGKLGEFHHALAAVAVDIVGKKFFMYQLNAESNGGFQHLNTYYHPDGSLTENLGVSAVVFGDTHRKFIDPKVADATFGASGIVETLDPEYLVFHDLHDGYAENPHHRGNPFITLAKRVSGFDNVEAEVKGDIDWLAKVCEGRQGVIVPSNHDNMLYRWVRDTDWRLDPTNAEFYLKTALYMAEKTRMTMEGSSTPDPFAYWVGKDPRVVNVTCLKPDEGFNVAGVELGFHGDKGPNGVRGTRNNMRRIGVKTVIGHAHSPGIEEGCYQAGTSTPLRLEYTGGPSSWLNTHVVVYPNGKRSLINIIDGQWRF